MTKLPSDDTRVRCACGSVELHVTGAPTMSVVCYCDDCQEGARRIEALPNAHPVLDPDGGTAYVLVRNDRFKCSSGAELLHGYKIREKSGTSRVVATCCNSAMYLSPGGATHWVSMHRSRFQGDAPPLQMRIFTKYKPAGSDVPNDVPNYATFPLKFIWRLLAARVAMLLRR